MLEKTEDCTLHSSVRKQVCLSTKPVLSTTRAGGGGGKRIPDLTVLMVRLGRISGIAGLSGWITGYPAKKPDIRR